jgi:hypothetical protein
MDTKHWSLVGHVRALSHLRLPQGARKGPGLARTVVLVILALGVLLVPNAPTAGRAQSTVAASLFQNRPVQQLLNINGTLNRNTGWSGTLDPRGWQVTLNAEHGPLFEPSGSLPINPAKPASGTWLALGTGTNGGGVSAIAISGNDVYVGGSFTSAGGVANTTHIAKWDGSTWSALGTGMDDGVIAIATSGGGVYVGGLFTTAGGVAANHIAKWDGGAWSALGTGTGDAVAAISVSGNDVYVGGYFSSAGGVAVNNIARWNGSAWSALGTGTTSGIYDITISGSDVYVGGYFHGAGGVAVNHIARWNGSAWSALGTGTTDEVYAIAASGSDVYVGGYFTSAGGVAANHIARWNGSTWSALGTGTDVSVSDIVVSESRVYVDGNFTSAGGVAANHVAKWNGSTWSALGTGTDNAWAIAVSGSEVYVGGYFASVDGVAVNNIAKYSLSGSPSTNADLSNLVLSSGTLAPPFASGTTTYTASVASDVISITVTPTASNAYAAITVNGTQVASGSASGAIALNVGANTITTVVTAEDDTTSKTYTVTVTRAPSTNADLSSLVLSSGTLTPPFASGTTTYTATVASCAISITVRPTAADASATLTVNGTSVVSGHASEAIALDFGANTITTVVTAQDGTTIKTYTVTVTRAAEIPCGQDGGTWTVVSSPITDTLWGLYSVAMVSTNDGWAVGNKGAAPNGYPYGPFILHWNGNTWSQASISDTGSYYGLNSIAMASANDGWAVGGWGSHYSGGNTAGLGNTSGVILHWDGNTWSRWSSSAAHLFSIAILSTTDVWAVGEYWYLSSLLSTDSVAGSATTHWDGTTWNEQIQTLHVHGLNSIAMVSTNDGWAVGNYETMHWDGNAWTTVSTPITKTLYSVAMVSANDGWAVGANGTILHWDGNTWSQVNSSTNNMLISVAMASANDGWVVGTNGTILHWDGNTWSQASSPVTQTLKSITMISANEGWAVGASGVILYYTNLQNVFLPLIIR